MSSPLVFILLAIIIASLHMIAPDHWLPLSALSVKRGYKQRRVRLVSALLGFLHGSTSVLLSLLILFLGLDLFGTGRLKAISIVILIAVALYILLNGVREGKAARSMENTSLLVSVFPDPAFLPIIIASAKFGFLYTAAVSFTFILSSIVSLILVLVVVMAGISDWASKMRPATLDRVIAIVLVLTAFYIYFYG